MNYYLIWNSGLPEQNVDAFNKLNSLRSLPLSPALIKWATDWGLDYPNDRGTQQYAELDQCSNPNSEYFGATAIALSESLYKSITPEIIAALQTVGIPAPSEGISSPVIQLPTDWFLPVSLPA